MRIDKDITELLEAGVIEQATANKITAFYKNKNTQEPNKLFVVFGVLGAVLVGLGIVLILAHNWDEFSRVTKTCLAFLPLLVGQGVCVFSFFKKKDSIAWKESSSVFLFFAVGASISLISQIYNLPGSIGVFIVTWMLLCLPLLYVMQSSATSLLYLIGITYYACYKGYWSYPDEFPYYYWLLLLLMLPHYYLLYKKNPKSNFMVFHNWLVPLSIIIVCSTVKEYHVEILPLVYLSALGFLYQVGNCSFFTNQKLRSNGFRVLGSIGTIITLIVLTFDGYWQSLQDEKLSLGEVVGSREWFAGALFSLLALAILYVNQEEKSLKTIKPFGIVFLIVFVLFFIGIHSSITVVCINILVFALGVLKILEGSKKDHFGILNYGLLIITTLIIARFFDTDLSFVFRGLLFITVGIAFFTTNYVMLKKRKNNEV